jgi:hypothetical protein
MSKYLIGWGYRYSRIFPPLTYSRQNQPRFPLSPYPSQIKENNANPIDYVNQHWFIIYICETWIKLVMIKKN